MTTVLALANAVLGALLLIAAALWPWLVNLPLRRPAAQRHLRQGNARHKVRTGTHRAQTSVTW